MPYLGELIFKIYSGSSSSTKKSKFNQFFRIPYRTAKKTQKNTELRKIPIYME